MRTYVFEGVLDDLTLDGPADPLEWAGGGGDGKQVQRLPKTRDGPPPVKIYHQLPGPQSLPQM